MSMRFAQLKRDRAALSARMESILQEAGEENRALTDRDQKDLVSLRVDAADLDTQIRRIESTNTIMQYDPVAMLTGRLIKKGDPDERDVPRVGQQLKSNLRAALQPRTAEEAEQLTALAGVIIGGSSEMSATATLTPAGDGSVFLPEYVAGAVERFYTAFSPVVNNCRVFPTDTGAPTKFPVISDSEQAEQLSVSELTGADHVVSGDTPPTAVGGPTMLAYKLSSKPVLIPSEMFTDTPLDIVTEIISVLMARIVRKENYLFTNGSGSDEAQGFLAGCSAFTSNAAKLSLDIALDLTYAVPKLYRPQGVYMCSDSTVRFLRKLKTGVTETDQRPLWSEGDTRAGVPPTLHGYPVIVNLDMPDIASDGSFTGSELAFGDFNRFLVRQVKSTSLYRYLVPAKDGVGVIAFRRSDSRILVPEAIYRLVKSGS